MPITLLAGLFLSFEAWRQKFEMTLIIFVYAWPATLDPFLASRTVQGQMEDREDVFFILTRMLTKVEVVVIGVHLHV